MTERPTLTVIHGSADAKDADTHPLCAENSIFATLSGFSADLLERHRNGSDQPAVIITALFKVLDEAKSAAMDDELPGKAFVHRVVGTTAAVVGVMLPTARPIRLPRHPSS